MCHPKPNDLLLLTSFGEEKGSQVFCSWHTPTAYPPWSSPQHSPCLWMGAHHCTCLQIVPCKRGIWGVHTRPSFPLLGTSKLHPCKSNRTYKAACQLVPWQLFKLCLEYLCRPELHSSLFCLHPGRINVERHLSVKDHCNIFPGALKYFPISFIC